MQAAAYLPPVARFGGIAWLIVAAAQLPRERQRRPDTVTSSPAVATTSAGRTTTGGKR